MLRIASSAVWLLPLLGCTDTVDDTGGSGDGGNGDGFCEAVEPECVDQIILDLSLHDDKVSDGEVDSTADGDGWVSTIDASAGGYNQAANNPWVYVRFTRDGMERVDIDDETALESLDWDLALRRFIIRINSGDSGPSCVGAATFFESTYEDLTSVPDGIDWVQDDFYTDSCTFINDSSGLEGSPQTALGGWWSYTDCVKTTGYPHLLQLRDGSVVKMVVESYYGTGQDQCNDGGGAGSGSGEFSIRWMYME